MEKPVRVTYERDTRRTYRFTQEWDDALVGTRYVKKDAFRERPPETVGMTIRAEDRTHDCAHEEVNQRYASSLG